MSLSVGRVPQWVPLRRPMSLPELAHTYRQLRKVAVIRHQVELYTRCVHAVASIIETDGILNESRIVRRLGYAHSSAFGVNFVWRRHPKLGRVIREYQQVMSAKRVSEIHRRVTDRYRVKLTEVEVINAAVTLYARGFKVINMYTLADELEVSRSRLWRYLDERPEIKQEVGLLRTH